MRISLGFESLNVIPADANPTLEETKPEVILTKLDSHVREMTIQISNSRTNQF